MADKQALVLGTALAKSNAKDSVVTSLVLDGKMRQLYGKRLTAVAYKKNEIAYKALNDASAGDQLAVKGRIVYFQRHGRKERQLVVDDLRNLGKKRHIKKQAVKL